MLKRLKRLGTALFAVAECNPATRIVVERAAVRLITLRRRRRTMVVRLRSIRRVCLAFPSAGNHGRSNDIAINISLSLSLSQLAWRRARARGFRYPPPPDRVVQINEVNPGPANEPRRRRRRALESN